MYLSVPFENGESMVVELPEGQGSGVLRATRGEALIESSAEAFESGLARVRHVAGVLLERLGDLPRQPDHIRAEFGIKAQSVLAKPCFEWTWHWRRAVKTSGHRRARSPRCASGPWGRAPCCLLELTQDSYLERQLGHRGDA
ncbi:CU044_2847 family protein [Kitasatospora sp. NPDC098652]|uniref:CU044_2847 family protein n=1 Tax=Kitasatospora sp. NPDC098652 TaxID=3364095 RepID=UPI0037F39061